MIAAFIAGFFIGAAAGVALLALCVVRSMDEERREDDQQDQHGGEE